MHKAQLSVAVEVVVPFYDLDPMEVVWHGHYAKYFELARCALLDAIDYGYPQMRASGYAWPVIEFHVRFAHPVRFKQRLTVRADLIEWEHRLKIVFQVFDAASGQRLTTGHTVQVAVHGETGEMCFVSPAILFEKLGVEPA